MDEPTEYVGPAGRMGPAGHIGQSGPPDDPSPTKQSVPTEQFSPTEQINPTQWFGPPEWVGPPPQAPMWRRRGPLALAGVLVLSIVGLVVGIVLSVPSPTPANTAVVVPATATTQPAAGHRKAARHKRRSPATTVPSVTTITNP